MNPSTVDSLLERLLQTENETLTSDSDDEELVGTDESTVLRNTLRVYGGIFLILFILFCYLRRRYPKCYNVRNWVEKLKTDLAEDQYGFFSWAWKVLLIPDEEVLDDCGMDALCFNRATLFGFKLTLVGMFNAIWLLPVYGTAREADETAHIFDAIVEVSVSHVPSGSKRLVGTVLAAYITFGFTMYLILKEFEWFSDMRVRFLSKTIPRNYSVYVQGIPPEYRSSSGLVEYFCQCFSNAAVLEAHIGLKTPALAKTVAARDAAVVNLEHAINVEEITGETPTHRNLLKGNELVNSIDYYSQELRKLNEDVQKRIADIQAGRNASLYLAENLPQDDQLSKEPSERFFDSVQLDSVDMVDNGPHSQAANLIGNDHGVGFDQTKGGISHLSPPNGGDNTNSTYNTVTFKDESELAPAGLQQEPYREVETGELEAELDGSKQSGRFSRGTSLIAKGTKNVTKLASSAVAILADQEDGEPLGAGFVSFTSLRTTQAALQMLHHQVPFYMEVLEAPDPDDVFWSNVGLTHKELQLGKLFSLFLTVLLCLFWTIPMSFIASLSSVEGLREQVGFIDSAIDTAPWLEPLLAQLAPLFVIIVNALLPMILERLSMLEGPVSGAVVEASTFTKLAAFMIIQTFFVSAISGGLMSEISNIVKEPTKAMDLLANSLPAQSTYFIQILLVDTFLSMALELLRVIPSVLAWVRSRVGPDLTEKERNTTYIIFRPFADPDVFTHAAVFAKTVLYFMVFFVYTTIAPITNFFMGVCFLLRAAAYRHQFVYIYPSNPDSGGKLWTSFIRISLSCMLVAQITLVGFLSLKKAAIATPLMFPLLIITVLFNAYIGQKHFANTNHLSSRDCLRVDLDNGAGGGLDFSFVKGKYLQPELKRPFVLPENLGVTREVQLGVTNDAYMTPDPSVSNDA